MGVGGRGEALQAEVTVQAKAWRPDMLMKAEHRSTSALLEAERQERSLVGGIGITGPARPHQGPGTLSASASWPGRPLQREGTWGENSGKKRTHTVSRVTMKLQ